MLLALTGATGFIGQHLLRELPQRGYPAGAAAPASFGADADRERGDWRSCPTVKSRDSDGRPQQQSPGIRDDTYRLPVH
jgi:nucleoside-diphosphate-sugar epimerase